MIMDIEPPPQFSAPAAKLWAGIPDSAKKNLLSNVWCGKCHHEVTITNFSGTVSSGDLLLVGVCAECHSDVAKLVVGVELRSD
jgi:hypothetical protein